MNAQKLTEFVLVLEERLNGAIKNLERLMADCGENFEAHGEFRRQTDVELRPLQDIVSELKQWKQEQEKEREIYLNLKRDVKDLLDWKSGQKADQSERSRRIWAFGPNILGAIITTLGNLIILGINVWLIYGRK